MPHRLVLAYKEARKRRALIALTAASVAAILALWILYMNWSLDSPDAAPRASAAGIFKTGAYVITRSIETGLINAYLYFHSRLTTGNTYILDK